MIIRSVFFFVCLFVCFDSLRILQHVTNARMPVVPDLELVGNYPPEIVAEGVVEQ